MVRAIVWKEFREQGLIALTLLVFGAGILIAAATLSDPPRQGSSPSTFLRSFETGPLATLLLAVTAGTVCGGALFAAEREAGTMGYLESLPTSRWDLWRAKMAAGLTLVILQVGTIVAVSTALQIIGSASWGLTVTVYAMLAFCWGVFGSTLARTTLGSVGVAIPAGVFASLVYLLLVTLLFPTMSGNLPRPTGQAVYLGLMFITPLVLSALSFTRPDRDRRTDDLRFPRRSAVTASVVPRITESTSTTLPMHAGSARLGFRALIWLSLRQVLMPTLVASAFALVCGLSLMAPGAEPALMWPPLALAAGTVAGVTVFGDEQSRGTARFWGERRLPIGRAWGVKVLIHLLLACWLLLLLTLPLLIRTLASDGLSEFRKASLPAVLLRSRLLVLIDSQAWKYLLVPAAYGFAAGHLCGLLFRKAVVAFGVAGLVGGTGAALWIPSLLAGGLTHSQVWLPAVAVLATARLLIRPWAAERLTARGPLLTLATGGAVAVLILAGGIGYRVLEVRATPDPEADIRYVTDVIPFDANTSGREFRSAADRFARAAEDANGGTARNPGPRRIPAEERLRLTLAPTPGGGWPAARQELATAAGPFPELMVRGRLIPPHEPELEMWLDRVCADETGWETQATLAAAQPIGVYEHPQLITSTGPQTTIENGQRMAAAMAARGLQQQVAGDPVAFAGQFRTGLTLARSMRTGSIFAAVRGGHDAERHLLNGADRWLERLPDGSGLTERLRIRVALAAALATARDANHTEAFDPTPHLLAERYVLREFLRAPGAFVGGDKDGTNPEADLLGFAWSVPWERERTRRLLGLGFEAGVPEGAIGLLRGRPGNGQLLTRGHWLGNLFEQDRRTRTQRGAVILRLAVRLYQLDVGSVPPSADVLVAAGYLDRIPADPYDPAGEPLRYRVVTAHEEYAIGRSIFRAVYAPGQAIIWSVGPNGTDAGGRESPESMAGPTPNDLVYPVPPPAPR